MFYVKVLLVFSLLLRSCQSQSYQAVAEAQNGVDSFLEESKSLFDVGTNNDGKRTIVYEDASKHKKQVAIISEADKLELKKKGIKFHDITNQVIKSNENRNYYLNSEIYLPKYNYPNKTNFHSEKVTELINEIDTQLMFDKLSNFSSFYTRYYKSETGYESTLWLYKEIHSLISDKIAPRVEVKLFDHRDWKQNSIIVTLYGDNAVKNPSGEGYSDKGPIVVLGCHLDSINLLFPSLLAAPGADDDGSGVTTVLETLRIILASAGRKFTFKNTIEFHFYSAEEGGLLGSLDIFHEYRKTQNLTVVAMLQQDMTGYIQRSLENGRAEHIGIMDDHTSQTLTNFVKELIKTYCLIPYHDAECGYACSDHSSALQNGYPSAFVSEAELKYDNPNIHSVSDTVDKLSFEHMAEYVKLGLGYVYELGMWEDIKEIEGEKELVAFAKWNFMIKRFFFSHYERFLVAVLLSLGVIVFITLDLVRNFNFRRALRNFRLRRKYRFLSQS